MAPFLKPGKKQFNMKKNPVKPADKHVHTPEAWKTGTEPITEQQEAQLKTLAEKTAEEIDTNLSKAGAAHKIDELNKKASS